MAYKRKSRKVGNTTITETYRSDGSKRTTYTRHGGSGAYRQTETYSISNSDQRRSRSTTIHGWVTRTSKKIDGKSRRRSKGSDWTKAIFKMFASSKKKVKYEDTGPAPTWAETWAEIKSLFKEPEKTEDYDFFAEFIKIFQSDAKKPKKEAQKEVRDFKGNIILPPK